MKSVKSFFLSHIWQRLRLMLLLVFLGLAVSVILAPAAQADAYTYAVKRGGDVRFASRSAHLYYDSPQFYIHPHGTNEPKVVLAPDQQVTVHGDGVVFHVTTRLETVKNLLERLEIAVDDTDMVLLEVMGRNLEISVTDEITAQYDHTDATPFKTKYGVDHLLPKGEKKIVRKGVPGTVTKTYEATYRMGRLVDTQMIHCTADTAVTQIVHRGTLVDSVSSGDYLDSIHPFENGSGGYLLFDSGDTMTYSYITDCSATAYATHGYTASGYPTAPGNIAVDPSVFPYGTRFYIESDDGWTYGMACARDCGSSIKGNKIDLWFDEYGTACAWGRRDCTVYVLN